MVVSWRIFAWTLAAGVEAAEDAVAVICEGFNALVVRAAAFESAGVFEAGAAGEDSSDCPGSAWFWISGVKDFAAFCWTSSVEEAEGSFLIFWA